MPVVKWVVSLLVNCADAFVKVMIVADAAIVSARGPVRSFARTAFAAVQAVGWRRLTARAVRMLRDCFEIAARIEVECRMQGGAQRQVKEGCVLS